MRCDYEVTTITLTNDVDIQGSPDSRLDGIGDALTLEPDNTTYIVTGSAPLPKGS